MKVETTVEQVASHVKATEALGGCLIGIDGFSGTGKTTLAFELAHHLNGIRLGLDSYVSKEKPADCYVGLLRIDHLRRDLGNLLDRFAFVVLDGVCLLKALESIRITPKLLVYVKKHSPQGLWHDGLHLENFLAGACADSWLAESVYRYHQAYQPHTKAAVYYHWAGV